MSATAQETGEAGRFVLVLWDLRGSGYVTFYRLRHGNGEVNMLTSPSF